MAETHTSVAPQTSYIVCTFDNILGSWFATKEGVAGPIALRSDDILSTTLSSDVIRETLLTFDLSAIPADATVISASLTLEVSSTRFKADSGYVSRIVGQIDPTWSSSVVTLTDWRKASYLVTRPFSFIVTTYSLFLTIGQTVAIPFTDLTGMFTGGTLGIVLTEVAQASNWLEPPSTNFDLGVGASFYSSAAAGRTPPTLTVVHKDGTYDPGDPEATGSTGGLIMGANF